jgi:Protein of unknown function (DUF4058)
MPSPFPGMNPYLEQPGFWSSFHSRLIVAIADALALHLDSQYYVEVEMRTYLDTPDGEVMVGIPDAVVLASTPIPVPALVATATQTRPQTVTLPLPIEVTERYLTVREVGNNAVITAIEVLSPTNKRPGKGRDTYLTKRQLILGSATHLVEIDLLRGGEPLPMQGVAQPTDYRILVSRSQRRPQADLYAFSFRAAIPPVPIPLKQPSEAVTIELQAIVNGVYDRARYDQRIDYREPLPNLSDADRSWLQERTIETPE